ncbi:hypothetical protein JKP88DRAFT_236437 [Tribonema minus]|uniref:Uncharacterized protein n=1 Tax=Tribonema minus TaxID=303371 RepID=A0A835Z3N0_9STRA|nr:hypothetical protein JKP88DRAFT_236437 [Tribonema minus]
MFSAAAAASRRSVPAMARRASRRAPQIGMQRRGMAGHGELYVSKSHTMWGRAYLTLMFTWMGYRAYEDGAVVLGLEHPWDHMDEHGHGNGHGGGHGAPRVRYRKTQDGMPEVIEDDEDEEIVEEEE